MEYYLPWRFQWIFEDLNRYITIAILISILLLSKIFQEDILLKGITFFQDWDFPLSFSPRIPEGYKDSIQQYAYVLSELTKHLDQMQLSPEDN